MINAFLTPDLLYAIGGAVRHIDFNPAPGTILTASPPAAVGCGSAIGCEATLSLANNAVARMMHPSPRLRRMYTANGGDTVWPIVSYGGIDQRGDAYQSIILDFYAAPIGAYQFRDGIDSAGPYWMAKTTSPNVEHNEQTTPILYLYRREMEDSPGAGRFVGGATIGVSFTAHKSDEILHQVATCGVTHPTATGLFGGMPGPPNTYRFKTGNGSVHDVVLRSDRLDPGDPDTRELSPKESNLLQRPGDIYEVICTGAAGFGDPLEREPDAVARDVDEGRYTRSVAERLFGVVFADGVAVDADATAERRRQVRLERLGAAREGRAYEGAPVERLFGAVTDTLDAGRATDGSLVLCSRYSGAPLCAIEDNYKDACSAPGAAGPGGEPAGRGSLAVHRRDDRVPPLPLPADRRDHRDRGGPGRGPPAARAAARRRKRRRADGQRIGPAPGSVSEPASPGSRASRQASPAFPGPSPARAAPGAGSPRSSAPGCG